ncbi:MAG TPA: hypothetical protein VN805_10740 [Caulobacteraceae bacterium]|nr:hypothetical protein [Caulobacteraceae bacterium]
MGERPQGADKGVSGPLSLDGLHSRRLWRSGRAAQLKLLTALRGTGALLWSGGSISATYELDVFSRGAVQTVSGQLEGDFSALVQRPAANEGEPSDACRLRLDDGREIEIDLVSLEQATVAFDAGEASARVTLLGSGAGQP